MSITILSSRIKLSYWRVFAALLLLPLVPCAFPSADSEPRSRSKKDPYLAARRLMVERDLRNRGIKDARVLAAMEAVPRHLFVPTDQQAAAYDDRPLPIGSGQTISQPYIVAYMSELLALKGSEKVLEIGTGSGYQAAVLAKLAAVVYSIEIIPGLAEQAQKRLSRLGVDNVQIKIGDGYFGWEEKAPFDAILFTAATPEVPPPLWRQLSEGGQIILPLGQPARTQRLTRVRKRAGKQVSETLTEVIFVPLTGAVERRSP